jgi:hypothetical protein
MVREFPRGRNLADSMLSSIKNTPIKQILNKILLTEALIRDIMIPMENARQGCLWFNTVSAKILSIKPFLFLFCFHCRDILL